ncbi:MAG: FMN-binding protein [Chloroflexi bacterium]|nr:FMN-binding protein [Chloroflexota bacterium]
MTVSVTISGGRIANVQITRVTTSFPESRIASLPAAVVASQSAGVNVISGATYSSTAFKQAVQAALSQAQAASTTTTPQG